MRFLQTRRADSGLQRQMHYRGWLPALLALAACGGAGESETEQDDPVDPASITVSNPGSGGSLALSKVKYWAYQIQDHYANPQVLADSHYDLLVIDQARSIADLQDYDDALLVSKLKQSANHLGGNKLVVAYIDVGQAEDYRWYWPLADSSLIAGPDPDGWVGNFPVKFWKAAWWEVVRLYLDRILEDGFDGIYMDWLEAYDFEPSVQAAAAEGLNLKKEMAKFVRKISEYVKAKKPGFLVIGQNALALGAEADYLSSIDGQAQESVWYGGDPNGASGDISTGENTATYLAELQVFQAAGKPIFTCDYATQPSLVATCYSEAANHGFVEYVTTVLLDRLTSTPPPGY